MSSEPRIDLVIKVGGGLLAHPDDLVDALVAIANAAERLRVVVVPGGGPFADTVRDIDRHLGLTDDEAHWMALLAMDQYAYVLATRLEGSTLVDTREAVLSTLTGARIPVVAPYRWLRDADPLPHSWDITSDSLSAWMAGNLGAEHLLLVKPPDAEEPFVDPYFRFALPRQIPSTVVRAGSPLRTALADWPRAQA
jgi:aspartokinase-like uncharacterized kinase